MKSLKMNGLTRLLAFVLIAVILISVISIAVGGKQSTPDNEPDSGDIGASTDETDENKDGTTTPEGDGTDEPLPDNSTVEEPKFFSPVTGMEITEEELNSNPFAFLLDSSAPIYGVSGADITVEIPLETGKTRLLVYHSRTEKLWKIGSLAAARDFISSMVNLFGGNIISFGNDDIVDYDVDSYKNSVIDLSTLRGSYSIENTKYIYTSISKINEAQNLLSDLNRKGYNKMPYIFSEKSVTGTTSANSITLPYQDNTETNLYYSERTGAYTLYKGSAKCVDKLNGADVSFKNVFVLFANSTTYESADGKELTMDTYSGGSGYYASEGYLTEINWRLTDDGSLVFTTLNGEVLEVNRGNAYVGYYKASVSSEVTVR